MSGFKALDSSIHCLPPLVVSRTSSRVGMIGKCTDENTLRPSLSKDLLMKVAGTLRVGSSPPSYWNKACHCELEQVRKICNRILMHRKEKRHN